MVTFIHLKFAVYLLKWKNNPYLIHVQYFNEKLTHIFKLWLLIWEIKGWEIRRIGKYFNIVSAKIS